jgi:Holliday junction resolvasome RuvABC endonuclease subunit
MDFLGLDLSLNNTGISIVNRRGKPILIESIEPKIKPADDEDGIRRGIFIADRIAYLIKDRDISLTVIEDCFSGKNVKVLKSLAQLHGVVKQLLAIHRIKYLVLPPLSLKSFILPKSTGGSKKNHILKEVYKKYNLDLDDDNKADAFLLSKIAQEYTFNCYLKSKKSLFLKLKK